MKQIKNFIIRLVCCLILNKKLRKKIRSNLLKKNGLVAKTIEPSSKEIETFLAIVEQNRYDISKFKHSKKVVIFFEIEPYRMCGGQISLFSYCKYSQEVLGDEVAVLMSTLPGKYTHNHNNNFDNDIDIYRWEQVKEIIKGKEHVILHIPEADIVNPETNEELLKVRLTNEDMILLKSIKNLQVNIVNQQIEKQPSYDKIKWIFNLTNNVTTTVCNCAAATQYYCNQIRMPLHMLSVYYSWGDIDTVLAKEKQKLILLSPDLGEKGIKFKVNFIKKINEELPDYKVCVIHDLTLHECMSLMSVATAVVTFGEGFDGYFNNAPQVGTLAFSVYNDTFFPDEHWKDYPNVYDSYEEMNNCIVRDISFFMANPKKYNELVHRHANEILKLYDFHEYLDNLRRFYNKQYDFYPKQGAQND